MSAQVTLNQWKIAQLKKNGPLFLSSRVDLGLEQWSKFDLNKINVNVDGVIFASEGWFGAGGVARDCHGHLIEAFFVSKSGCVDAAIAEIIGINEALSWIKRKN
uniref:RNase H type-1 domain-containing protein n=1 Tax=Cannabis sativa TaxID=3483 RepID=A0A803P3J5_CANSA